MALRASTVSGLARWKPPRAKRVAARAAVAAWVASEGGEPQPQPPDGWGWGTAIGEDDAGTIADKGLPSAQSTILCRHI